MVVDFSVKTDIKNKIIVVDTLLCTSFCDYLRIWLFRSFRYVLNNLFMRTDWLVYKSSLFLDTYRQGTLLLKNLSRTSRFAMMLMFLSTQDKTLLKTTVDLLETRVKQNGDKNVSADVSNLRTSYRCS